MGDCSHDSCTTKPKFNVKGSRKPVYCQQHAKDGMVNVRVRRCSHDSCTITPIFNTEGCKRGEFCKKHAEEGMVNVVAKRCAYDSCITRATFNFEGVTKLPGYCKQHAEHGMKRSFFRKDCSHDSCTTKPTFNFEYSKSPVCCKQHAEQGMVDVHNMRCAHISCRTSPSFNVGGSKKAVYCKQHAEEGMVSVRKRRCAHGSCVKRPCWGVLRSGGSTATVCARHKSDILSSPLINFRAMCAVACCRKESRWGLGGEQPSHCPDHGPLEDGLICTVFPETVGGKRSAPSIAHRAKREHWLHVKTECSF